MSPQTSRCLYLGSMLQSGKSTKEKLLLALPVGRDGRCVGAKGFFVLTFSEAATQRSAGRRHTFVELMSPR